MYLQLILRRNIILLFIIQHSFLRGRIQFFIYIFTATEYHDVFGNEQPCENGVSVHCFGNYPCLHHQGLCHGSSSSSLMTEAETGSETLHINSILTQLIYPQRILRYHFIYFLKKLLFKQRS